MVSVCSPLLQFGQSFSVFTFSSRGFIVFAKLLFLVSDFHTVFNRGSSSTSMSTIKMNIYEDCLFKRRGFPCRVRWKAPILLYFFLPFNYQPPIMAVPNFPILHPLDRVLSATYRSPASLSRLSFHLLYSSQIFAHLRSSLFWKIPDNRLSTDSHWE